jgi:hypothetical protein
MMVRWWGKKYEKGKKWCHLKGFGIGQIFVYTLFSEPADIQKW